MEREVRVRATGHEHVTAAHGSTFEVTTDDFLTPAGDCILGIEADMAPADVPSEFVEACQDASATIEAVFEVDGHTERIRGRGDPQLTFEDERGFVGRTSTYVDDRTLMVEADGASADLDRDLVAALESGADLTVRLLVR